MGHARGETTQVYLRRLNRRRRMDSVRGLSWATVPAQIAGKLLESSSNGEGGIRTLDGGIHPHNALAGRRLQPLGHFSVSRDRIARSRPHSRPQKRSARFLVAAGSGRRRCRRKRGEPAFPCSSAPVGRACLRRVISGPDVRKAASRRCEERVSRPLGLYTVGCGPHCAELDRREHRLSDEHRRIPRSSEVQRSTQHE